jgi:hypothetical protein
MPAARAAAAAPSGNAPSSSSSSSSVSASLSSELIPPMLVAPAATAQLDNTVAPVGVPQRDSGGLGASSVSSGGGSGGAPLKLGAYKTLPVQLLSIGSDAGMGLDAGDQAAPGGGGEASALARFGLTSWYSAAAGGGGGSGPPPLVEEAAPDAPQSPPLTRGGWSMST